MGITGSLPVAAIKEGIRGSHKGRQNPRAGIRRVCGETRKTPDGPYAHQSKHLYMFNSNYIEAFIYYLT